MRIIHIHDAFVVRDIEKRTSTKGNVYYTFGVVHRNYQETQSYKKSKTDPNVKVKDGFFINVNVFNVEVIRSIGNYIKKGSCFHLIGEYDDELYTSNTGEKRIARSLTLSNITFASTGGNRSDNSATQQVAVPQANMAQQMQQMQQPMTQQTQMGGYAQLQQMGGFAQPQQTNGFAAPVQPATFQGTQQVQPITSDDLPF